MVLVITNSESLTWRAGTFLNWDYLKLFEENLRKQQKVINSGHWWFTPVILAI
jgi:hypothetical protein